jgi:hypothetical protein
MAPALIDEQGISDNGLLRKLADFVGRIGGDTDNLWVFCCVFIVNATECRHFFSARRAPSGPEIYDQELPLPLT